MTQVIFLSPVHAPCTLPKPFGFATSPAHHAEAQGAGLQWRQQQRMGQSRPRLILCEAGDTSDGSEDGGESHQGTGPGKPGSQANQRGASQLLAALGMREGMDVRLRTSGILERDREDTWDAVD